MGKDQFRFRKRLLALQKNGKSKFDNQKDFDRLTHEIELSIAKKSNRIKNRINPKYPDNLPIVQVKEKISKAIAEHQVIIVCGETGSGKTTQLPKFCLELGRGCSGNIGHTQPRRLAARSVATRIAQELQSELGDLVGFKVRFTDQVSTSTRVKLMTDGILLAEIQKDPYLNQYDTLIIDEAHERSLNIDFLLGYLKQLLPRRPDLKVIITSATLDPQRFSEHFDNAPVIAAQGRSWPVDVRYRPIEELQDEGTDDSSESIALLNACEELCAEGEGDILIFLPGEREIKEHDHYLRKKLPLSKRLRGTDVLPLFARLSVHEQQQIFAKHSKRRVVLSTNVAETSLTVPGIRYVVDFGVVRMSRYSVRSKVQRLPIEKISRASANQRMGRCGREAPGVCIRLYSEEDFLARREFTDPEIQRTNLASVILQMASMRLGSVEKFPFIEPPEQKYINDGYRLLLEIGAVDNKRKINKLGKILVRLPVDPRFAKMLVVAKEEGCIEEVLTIVSALSIQDPRERPFEKRQAADELHAEFNDKISDFTTWLNLWEFLELQSRELSANKFRKMCKQRFVSWLRVREWRDVRKQLVFLLKELGFAKHNTSAQYENIHRSLLSGLLSNVCITADKNEYLGTRNRRVYIFPGSALIKSRHKWVMSAEISETSRLYARSVAMIKPEWIESLSAHLLKYSYFGESWQAKRGQVGAYRKSTLYGLEINPKKRVNYGPIDPKTSREIFIRQALVEGKYTTKAGFFHHNLSLLEEVFVLEEKTRRRDILVDEQQLYCFYNEIIPEGIYSKPQFEKWREGYEKSAPKGLYFSREMLFATNEEFVLTPSDFPDVLEFSGIVLPLSYKFEPGARDDGVTLSIPATVVNRVSHHQCEWLVPGMLEEKLIALLKGLPKHLRKNFVPVPDYARDCHQRMSSADRHLYTEFSLQLKRINNVEVPLSEWQEDRLPEHLRMNFRLLDVQGNILDQGRDLNLLQRRFSSHVEEGLSRTNDNEFERSNVTDWNFGDLPESVKIENSGIIMQGYPALSCEGDSIALRLFASENKAGEEMRLGLRALYQKILSKEVKYLRRQLSGIDLLCLRFAPFGSCEELRDDIVNASINLTFILDRPYPRNREKFYSVLERERGRLVSVATELCTDLKSVFDGYRQVSKRLDGSLSLSWIEPVQDMSEQMSFLVYKGFVTQTPNKWLKRIPIYLKAIDRRLDSIDQSPDKDRRRRSEFLPLWEMYKNMPEQSETVDRYVEKRTEIRWLIEELKVSLFAQSIGTVEKVSISRLETRIKALLNN